MEDTQELSNIIRVTPQRISQMSREERLMEAINEIQNDTGFTQKELSQKYGVSESELSKKKNNLSFKPRGRYLTEAEELEMIKMVTQEIKKEYVEWLLGQFKKTDKKLLLVDNHISNYFFDEKKLCDENNLIIMTFPSNLTHILQPLDLVLFSSFSQHLSNLLRDGLKDNPKFKVNDKHYQMLAYHAWSSSFNSSNIRMSWIKSAEKFYLKGNRYSREQRDCSGKCSSHDPKRTGYSNER
ncbi:hypothetical protein PPL_10874 [Heterostelium album PN500]|uniref:DDE-1 domain-containing protein n=1 Tax=Heterostelium pallidum (strain ATCC 26659 / Pp 5 / PN500) TaxID=670386 RepID=D3BS82_HETP5|nr:hypothetical protein PPL_10874 [Heterostelium album PN500]EFA75819.1 hypothetical protein PPL_10874 [Heterostelium album PN500]|eukprot:XP_020427953.1 hypothetical protein PPL_10874 [Heterostelium album PN500]